ncbi:MAG: CotS family spore coat protein [Chitinophagales bacterium]
MENQPILAMNKFGRKASNVATINLKGKKAVWRVTCGKEVYYLKKMPVSRARSLFVIAAWRYLSTRGIGLPKLITASDNNYFAEIHGDIYILTESITGPNPEVTSLKDKITFVKFLAQFHQASQGFIPPFDCEIHSLSGSLTAHYNKKKAELLSYEKQAATKTSSFARLFLQHLPVFLQDIEQAHRLLTLANYERISKEMDHRILVHQDFAPGNVIQTNQGLYVMDLDSVAFDLPYRDIRKVLNKLLKKDGVWPQNAVVAMLKAYHTVHPLNTSDLQILWADLQFPHLFCGIANKYFKQREPGWNQDKYLERLKLNLRSETAKRQALKGFENIIGQVLNG